MAEGGSKYSLSGGHEEFFEWQCKICEDDGIPKEATAYCTTCGDCFCSTCAKSHIKFNSNKHKVVGEKEKADWGRSKGETGIFCSDHHGQQVSMYCAVHDTMCCPVCAVLKHSDSCKPQMSYIPDVAKGMKEGAEYKAVITDNDNLISSITALAKVRTNLQAKLKASRDECTRRIETFHKKLAMHLNKLKEESIAEMNKSHDEMVQHVEEDIKTCRNFKQELQDMKEQLSPSVSVSESVLFTRMKNGKKCLPNYKDLINNLAALERNTFEFIQSDSYSKSVCSARTLGECIGVTQTPEKPRAPMPVKEAKDQCSICKGNITKPRTLDCGHKFCTDCIETSLKCPTCGEVCGVLTGHQPSGTMNTQRDGRYYRIDYTFPSGVQGSHHPNPGRSYEGRAFTGHLPNWTGVEVVLQLLKIAFDRKLMFTIGSSGKITWNGIVLPETNPDQERRSLSVTGFLKTIKEQLAAKGVTERDISTKHQ